MSTSGSFTPASTPECAYEPEMTLAEALARRAAGTLDPNCVVVITDGPVIGTPGNTSPTTIELNPVTPNDLGMTARVRTNFNTAAWDAIFDPDLGPNGSIQRLTDEWNNTAQDADLNAPTVHTQTPWHAGGNTFRDNFFDDCSLTGWSAALAAGVTIRDNHVQEAGVDLTGVTSGNFVRNEVIGGQIDLHAPSTLFNSNTCHNSLVTHNGTGAGLFTCVSNQMLPGNVVIDAATTAAVDVRDNSFTGDVRVSGNGYRIEVTGKTGGTVVVSDNQFIGINAAAPREMLLSGAGAVSVTRSEFRCNNTGVTAHVTASGAFTATRLRMSGGVLSSTGGTLTDVDATGSDITLSGASVLEGGSLVRTVLNTAGFSMDTFDITGGTKTLTAAQSDRVRNALGTNLV